MNEPIYITEEELEYYTKPYKTLNEGNVGNVGILSDEESDKLLASSKWYTIEEFSEEIGRSIMRLMPDP